MSRVLLVDTNVSSLPVYQFLVSEGCEVFVVGKNPDDFLAKCARQYIQLDYSHTEALRHLVTQLQIDYLVPGCNDLSYKVCAAINDNQRFPGIETNANTEILNNKERFREFAAHHGLPVPATYHQLNDIEFPVIVKPAEAFSGRGISIVRHEDRHRLDQAILVARQHSSTQTCVTEQYVSGQLYSHTAFISGQKIVADLIVEEYCVANPFAVDTSRVARDFPPHVLAMIRFAIEKLTGLLQLKDGLLHTQFLNRADQIWLIEPTRRCPGDLYSRLIELATDLNYAENYARPFMGLPYRFASDTSIKHRVLRHTITDPVGGHFQTLRFNEPARISEYVALCASGESIQPAPAGRVGILFASAHDDQEFEALYQSAIARTLYTLN